MEYTDLVSYASAASVFAAIWGHVWGGFISIGQINTRTGSNKII